LIVNFEIRVSKRMRCRD